ncbi:DUF7546 family protein [Haloarchaeobius iranensis]|uniref:Uncharacterized protein n=1 Tax=Haloarchaeobius iranensis TaxID=996166 RepID=A0A1G9XEJ7_9EURY|nr:hypothetical protein [Haloarchaeobius iranensis]SDM95117.1 hypothetical protein SAMN05192554_11081 [Haloarchaeobius iranensis]
MSVVDGRPRLPLSWVALAVVAGVTVGYWLAVDPVVQSAAQVGYPLLWLAASAVGVRVAVDAGVRSLSPLPALGGAAYTVALLWTAGLLAPAASAPELSVHLAIPGWGPAVHYVGPVVALTVVPFLVGGYATLGLLAAVAVDRSWNATMPGAVGLLACVSCTAPLVATLAGSLGAGSLAATLSTAQYPVATAAFLLSIGGFAAVLRRTAV